MKTIRQLNNVENPSNGGKSILTFNFEQPPSSNLQANIGEFFGHAVNYQKHFYNISRQHKILTGYSLTNDAKSILYFTETAKDQKIALYPFDPSQSEMILNKANETLKSFEKNIFLNKIAVNLYTILIKETDNVYASLNPRDQKRYIENLTKKGKNFDVSTEFIKQLDLNSQIFPLFKLDYVNIAYNWNDIVKNLNSKYKNRLLEETNNITNKLDRVVKQSISTFATIHIKVIDDLEKHISSKDNKINILNYYVTNLYLSVRDELEKYILNYFPDVNSSINDLLQQLPIIYKDINESNDNFLEQDTINKYTYYLKNNINYSSEKAKEEFLKVFIDFSNSIPWNTNMSEEGKPTEFKNSYLYLSKNSPSYPSIKPGIGWDKENRVSKYDFKLFENNRFYYIYTKRLIAIIAKSSLYSYLKENQTKEPQSKPSELLKNYIENAIKLPTELNSKKFKISEISKKNLTIYKPLNKYLTDLVVDPKIEHRKNIYNIFDKMKKEIEINNIEFYILNRMDKGLILDLIDKVYVREFDYSTITNVTKTDIPELIKSHLEKLEKHLYLDQDHDIYQVFDKIAFKRYYTLQDLYLQSTNKTRNIQTQFKSLIKNLGYSKPRQISLKTSRMTNRTQGNSTIIQDLVMVDGVPTTSNNFHALLYPIKIQSGKDVKVRDSLEKAVEFVNKNPDYGIKAGFLNGDKDTKFKKVIHQFVNSKGESKQYTTYEDWSLSDGEITVSDKYRSNYETVGATAPAGYPKLYFFLVPKNIDHCTNLLVPVDLGRSGYYIEKYIPHNYIHKYLEIMKAGDKRGELEFRAFLRNKYSLSSFEINIQESISVKDGKFYNRYTANGHFQTGIARKVIKAPDDPSKNKLNFNNDELTRFETILSVDIGEINLATICIRKIDWHNKKLSENEILSYLPLRNDSKDNLQTILDFSFDRKLEIPISNDTFTNKYSYLKNRYKQTQKNQVIIPLNLKNKKKGLLDYSKQEIVNQIVKIAIQHKSLVVFENLDTGFNSGKLEVSLATDIIKLTYNKLSKAGHALGFDIDKEIEYIGANGNKGIAKINPFNTSKLCSACGYNPLGYNPKLEESLNFGRVRFEGNWFRDGILKVILSKDHSLTLNDDNQELIITDENGTNRTNNYITQDYVKYVKVDGTDNKIALNHNDYLKHLLFTKTNKQRVKSDEIVKKALTNSILNGRNKRDEFKCPNCKYRIHADYNAARNIGQKFVNLNS